jgi:hypothetical protein
MITFAEFVEKTDNQPVFYVHLKTYSGNYKVGDIHVAHKISTVLGYVDVTNYIGYAEKNRLRLINGKPVLIPTGNGKDSWTLLSYRMDSLLEILQREFPNFKITISKEAEQAVEIQRKKDVENMGLNPDDSRGLDAL